MVVVKKANDRFLFQLLIRKVLEIVYRRKIEQIQLAKREKWRERLLVSLIAQSHNAELRETHQDVSILLRTIHF